MTKLALIFLGSGLGGLARYLLGGGVQRIFNGTFPAGTLFVNVSGCLLIGLMTASLSGRILVREDIRIGLVIGVLGGFTTFSAFGMETFALLADGQFVRAGVNILANVVLGLTAVWFGYRLAQFLFGA